MALQWRNEDLNQMKRVETQVARLLRPYRATTEAGLVVFALIRCARTLLRLYPKPTQDQLTPVLVAYLEGRAQAPNAEKATSLILSPS